MMEDWGEIKLAQIDSDVFWSLIDELYDDNSVFICNRTKILEAYTKGNLYGFASLLSLSAQEKMMIVTNIKE